jgi:hypothetical protein
MVCGGEVRGDISHTLANAALSPGTSTWADRLYTCTYLLPNGRLVLSVKDSASSRSGHRYFQVAHKRADEAQPLGGLLNLGLPSYGTPDGTVVFLKDGKTLKVDASNLHHQPGAQQRSPVDVAYAVAAVVIACWSE